jgi:hypothetical protein
LLDVLLGLGCALAKRRRLPCLREEQEHEDRESDDGGESSLGSDGVNEVADRECEWNGCH